MFLGYSKEELLAIDPMDIFAEDSKKLVIERMKKITAEEQIAPSVEYKIITKDGREIWVLVNSRKIYKIGKENTMCNR